MNNTKIRRLKGNILDITVVLVLLSILLCTYVKLNSQKLALLSSDYKNADVTVRISASDSDELFSVGSNVKFSSGTDNIGKVKSVEPVYSVRYIKGENKLLTKIQTNEVVAYSVTIACRVKKDSSGCYISASEFVATGSEVSLTENGENILSGTVTGITINE